MASLSRIVRVGSRVFGNTAAARNTAARGFATATASGIRRAGVSVTVLLAGTAVAYGASQLYNREEGISLLPSLSATSSTPQPCVCAENKTHSIFIWIHLKPDANVKECAKVTATLQDKVKQVTGPDPYDEDAIFAGVGFGYNFYKLATSGKGASQNYVYPFRKGYLGEMPSTGGDIFVHAKSDSYSNLYSLTQLLIRSFPAWCIEKAEDVYGWRYQEGRDLSGFINGTENPAEEEDRVRVAVNDQCGGSYCVTQRWIHQFDVIHNTKNRILENWVGRTKPDSTEQSRKSPSSHVARMVGSTTSGQPKPFEMVRHSQPYGSVCGESGLFFIGYAASPDNIEFMLDRMVGADRDGLCDDVMRLSRCVSGNYWYFPSQEQLKKLC